MTMSNGFLYGVIGGALAELLGLFKLRQQAPGSLPQFLRSRFYWTVTALMICGGGTLVAIYLASDTPLNAFLAVNVGASAPLGIGAIVAQVPSIEPGKTK